MRIAISLQYNHDFAEIAGLTLPVIEAYALKHGYSAFINRCDMVSPEIVWQRCPDERMLLDTFDAVVHLDADILITNPEVTIESLIELGKQQGMEHGPDYCVGTDLNGINNGFSLWMNSWRARVTLGKLMRTYFADKNLYSSPQDALMDGKFAPELAMWKMPQRLCNSYLHTEYGLTNEEGEWQAGDFILHLPGMGNARRVEILKEHLSK